MRKSAFCQAILVRFQYFQRIGEFFASRPFLFVGLTKVLFQSVSCHLLNLLNNPKKMLIIQTQLAPLLLSW